MCDARFAEGYCAFCERRGPVLPLELAATKGVNLPSFWKEEMAVLGVYRGVCWAEIEEVEFDRLDAARRGCRTFREAAALPMVVRADWEFDKPGLMQLER